MTTDTQSSLVFSYLELRRAIGVLGLLLPFLLALGGWLFFGQTLQPSLSAYYYTPMRDVFVGVLFAIGFFLFSYRGYEPEDDLAGNLACLFALGVALFPTAPLGQAYNWVGIVHLISASLFFFTLAYFSLVLFTKTNPHTPPTPRKLQRNQIYRVCGWLIIAAVVLIAGYTLLLPAETMDWLDQTWRPTFWLEALAILAFGFSWFVKGEAILADDPES